MREWLEFVRREFVEYDVDVGAWHVVDRRMKTRDLTRQLTLGVSVD